MTPDEKIKYLSEHIQQLRQRVLVLEQLVQGLATILSEKPVHEKDTDHD